MLLRLHIALLAAILLSLPLAVSASAETLQGVVKGVDPRDGSLELSRVGKTGESETLEIGVEERTRYEGVRSLDELQNGDEVRVEAVQNALTRAWKASSVVQTGPVLGDSFPKVVGTDSALTASETPVGPNDLQEHSDPTLDQSAAGAAGII